MTPSHEWLSTRQVCELAGITERTLRKWVTAGRLTRHKDPTGHPRYRRAELDELLLEKRRRLLESLPGEFREEAEPPAPPPPTHMHEAAAQAQAQAQGDQQLRLLLDRAIEATHRAEELLAEAREQIAWLRARVEQSEQERADAAQERAELLRLILADRLRALPEASEDPAPVPEAPPRRRPF